MFRACVIPLRPPPPLCHCCAVAVVALAACTTPRPLLLRLRRSPSSSGSAPAFRRPATFFKLPNLAPDRPRARRYHSTFLEFLGERPCAGKFHDEGSRTCPLRFRQSRHPVDGSDDTGSPADAAAAAQKLLDQGAEIILGRCFPPSVSAVAPLAATAGCRCSPFSTDRTVAGDGVYLLTSRRRSEVKAGHTL